MTYTKKKFIFFIFLSLGLHSIVLAFIYNLSNSFVSSESSIVEVKFEKFSEEMHSKQSKPFKNKTKSNKTNSEQNNATIPSKKIEIKKKTSIRIGEFEKNQKENQIINKKESYKELSNNKKNFASNNSNINYQNETNNKKTLKSRAEYNIGSHNNPHPQYPLIARKKGWEGRVIVQANVNKTGNVTYLKILKSSGFKILDNESVKTLKKWKFTPARSGSEFIDDTVNIPINFILKD